MIFLARSLICLFLLLLIGLVPEQQPEPVRDGAEAAREKSEYEVYSAALGQMKIDGEGRHILIGERTSSFSCDSSDSSGLVVNECSGMRQRDQSPRQALKEYCSTFKGVLDSTLEDFETVNQNGHALKPGFSLKGKYALYGQEHPDGDWKAWGQPDFAVYVSRAGFDTEKSQALVYIAAVSWTDTSLSGGQYVFLQKNKNAWKIKDASKTWEMP
jgi:hypothetical protein